jgi:hypothetical protein
MCQVGLCRETSYRLRIPTPQTRRPAPAESGMGVERCAVLETSRAPQSSPRPAWSVSKHSARGRDTGVGRPASWSREGERTSVWIQMHRSYSFIISLVSVRPIKVGWRNQIGCYSAINSAKAVALNDFYSCLQCCYKSYVRYRSPIPLYCSGATIPCSYNLSAEDLNPLDDDKQFQQ